MVKATQRTTHLKPVISSSEVSPIHVLLGVKEKFKEIAANFYYLIIITQAAFKEFLYFVS